MSLSCRSGIGLVDAVLIRVTAVLVRSSAVTVRDSPRGRRVDEVCRIGPCKFRVVNGVMVLRRPSTLKHPKRPQIVPVRPGF